MEISINPERPDTADAMQLIDELEADLALLYPSEHRYGYNVEKLLQQGVHFFVLHFGGELAGCGGVQFYGQEYAELKRMYVRPQFRGQGLGKALVDFLAEYTRDNEITLLRLETGTHQHAAIHLYERIGFQRVPPFGDYVASPDNIFYEMRLTP
ncbi:MAG: GNAT family N-acetyltransferase [Anaerolineae bacterium]|nr:GNAT family N-acetyltransferase [Anaerolineae bacterium]